jgi:hypothetical protein
MFRIIYLGGTLLLLSQWVAAEPTWAIPNLEFEFCPLSPPQPCPTYHIDFIVNISDRPYIPSGGKDTRCRNVLPTDRVITEWQKCDDPTLQWRWVEFDNQESRESMWPRDKDGYAHVGLRQLNAK